MHTIPANELKRCGVSAFLHEHETLVTVRGKGQYIVLDIDRYEHFRETELELALIQAKKEISTGKYVIESVDKHIKRITKKQKSK